MNKILGDRATQKKHVIGGKIALGFKGFPSKLKLNILNTINSEPFSQYLNSLFLV